MSMYQLAMEQPAMQPQIQKHNWNSFQIVYKLISNKATSRPKNQDVFTILNPNPMYRISNWVRKATEDGHLLTAGNC